MFRRSERLRGFFEAFLRNVEGDPRIIPSRRLAREGQPVGQFLGRGHLALEQQRQHDFILQQLPLDRLLRVAGAAQHCFVLPPGPGVFLLHERNLREVKSRRPARRIRHQSLAEEGFGRAVIAAVKLQGPAQIQGFGRLWVQRDRLLEKLRSPVQILCPQLRLCLANLRGVSVRSLVRRADPLGFARAFLRESPLGPASDLGRILGRRRSLRSRFIFLWWCLRRRRADIGRGQFGQR